MHPIRYAICGCYVWPVVPYQNIGRCGRCGEQPDGELGLHATREQALEVFVVAFGRQPEPIGTT